MTEIQTENIISEKPPLPYSINELRLLSINEARKLMGIRFDSLKKLITEGKIEVIEIENKIKIPYMSLLKFQRHSVKFINRSSENSINDNETLYTKLEKIINKHN